MTIDYYWYIDYWKAQRAKGWQLMISGEQNGLISGWYLFDIIDIQLLDSVETSLFSSIFQVYTLWPPSADICLIGISSRYFFIVLLKSVISLKFWQFSLDIRLWYLWYPADILKSGVQTSSKVLPLATSTLFYHKTMLSMSINRKLSPGTLSFDTVVIFCFINVIHTGLRSWWGSCRSGCNRLWFPIHWWNGRPLRKHG